MPPVGIWNPIIVAPPVARDDRPMILRLVWFDELIERREQAGRARRVGAEVLRS